MYIFHSELGLPHRCALYSWTAYLNVWSFRDPWHFPYITLSIDGHKYWRMNFTSPCEAVQQIKVMSVFFLAACCLPLLYILAIHRVKPKHPSLALLGSWVYRQKKNIPKLYFFHLFLCQSELLTCIEKEHMCLRTPMKWTLWSVL